MLRAVIAALLAVALLAASQPALERARVDHADSLVADEVTAVRTVIRDLLARDDPVPAGAPGARRTLPLRLPGRSLASSGVVRVVLGPNDTRPDRLAWRVRGGGRTHVRVGVDVRKPDGGPLILRRSGVHRLVFRLVSWRGRPTVVVQRLEFKPEAGATPEHARALG